MLGERQRRSRTALSAVSLRHLLDSIGSRLDENRDISGYLRNLLIFLGLLGTFWGLIQAIGAIGGVIAGLTVGSGDFVAVFNEFKAGLLQPLQGMGTAFSASLFGLAGSLVLGFLDLQASQAEQHFSNELEEWLSGHHPAGGAGRRRCPTSPAARPCRPTCRPCCSRRPTISTGCSR